MAIPNCFFSSAAFASVAVLTIFASYSLADDKIVVRHRGADVSVSEIADVSYIDAVATVEKLDGEWILKRNPPASSLRMAPYFNVWKPSSDSTLLDYYRSGLRELLSHYVLVKVFERFTEEFPDNGSGYDHRRLDDYNRESSIVQKRFDDVIIDCLERGIDGHAIDQQLEKAFPKLAKLKEDSPSYALIGPLGEQARKDRPYLLIRCRCFPARNQDRPSLWMKSNSLNAVSVFHMRAEWKAHRDRYISAIANRDGKARFVVFQNVDGRSSEVCDALSKDLTTPTGSVALGGVDKAQAVLQQLGSPSRIMVIEDRCKSLLGDLATRIQVQRIAVVNESILVYQVAAPELQGDFLRFLNSKEGAESPFVVDTLGEVVIRPIVKQVLGEMEEVEFKLPTVDEIVLRFGRGHIPQNLYGIDFPQFRVETMNP